MASPGLPIFLSDPQRNNGFFFLLTNKYCIFILCLKRLPEVPEYAEM